ncbi:LysE family translocator [Chromobacterium sp. IIBBL 290-4]|uniref:LysE family translocator n=1 Tax=Chromobacterium sp. IIBBL 290-4 TaxID=2953890 RepID=UPI0020B6881A|nr:LysE family transporter [Chromobacterium sp. IIBBL 290-4]UTH72636.1 LysE family transporter [Chromobacterium sp. IIBBL 290-4]
MQHLPELLAIAAALAVGVASPGPSFIMIVRTAAGTGRSNGLLSALGMGIGGMLFAIASLLGLHGLLLAVPSLYIALKVLGGLYLAYMGFQIWQGAKKPLEAAISNDPSSPALSPRYLLQGLSTQLSNPKTAVVYASVFAAFLPNETTLAFKCGLAATVFCIESGWYALVATLLSMAGPRASYLRGKKWLDRAAGGIMAALGLKLAASI